MLIQKVVPYNEIKKEEIISAIETGEIIRICEGIYQIKLFNEPHRKIFTTSVSRAFQILQKQSN